MVDKGKKYFQIALNYNSHFYSLKIESAIVPDFILHLFHS